LSTGMQIREIFRAFLIHFIPDPVFWIMRV